MRNIKVSFPRMNTDVLVYNKALKEFQIDRLVVCEGSTHWCWLKNNKNDISHWQYLPSKPNLIK